MPSDKGRQSSGGKSFLGRKLQKERPPDIRVDESFGGNANAASTSRSSRYSRYEATRMSVDLTNEHDHNYPMSGVITAIPYDSVLADPKSPVPVDYLPKSDPHTRKEPSPHQLNKTAYDFHQYPVMQPPPTPQNGYSHPSGPRPPPTSSSSSSHYHQHHTTMAPSSSGDKGVKPQQWGSAGHGYPSHSTPDSSTNSRTSLDQVSVYSSHSSVTKGSTYPTSDTSSRPYTAGHHQGSASNTSATRQGNHSQTGSHTSTYAPGSSSETSLQRPKDDRIVDQMFYELMIKRGWQNLPEQAKRQMLAYPTSKKWTLVHQDRLAQMQSEQKRKQNARLTYGSSDYQRGLLGRADEEGSPEWYVKKVMDDTITSKELGSLSVSLRTQPIR